MHVEIEFSGPREWIGTITEAASDSRLAFTGRLDMLRALDSLVESSARTQADLGVAPVQ